MLAKLVSQDEIGAVGASKVSYVPISSKINVVAGSAPAALKYHSER